MNPGSSGRNPGGFLESRCGLRCWVEGCGNECYGGGEGCFQGQASGRGKEEFVS
jgi:hypothetical protein